jgi:5'-nucleotidase/UDP-sugar diphosphatase
MKGTSLPGRISLLLALACPALQAACDDTEPLAPFDAGADVAVDADAAPPVEVAPDIAPEVMPTGTAFPLTILHTNDLHSHLNGHAPEADYTPATPNDDTTVGGFARLVTAIGMQKAAAAAAGKDVLLLDGGDFMMGTLFQLASTQAAAELGLMHAAGYDAIAVGNHEFDWTTKGLAGILAAAVKNNTVVPLLASNLRFSAMDGDNELEMFKDPGPLKTKFVKTTAAGVKVGFIGLLGTTAQQFATGAQPATFVDYKGAEIKALVEELRMVDKVDLVVALSHSGIDSAGRGEDRALAEANLGIDVIVSGHTHDKLEQPVVVGRTVIVTAGSYGAYLGKLDIEVWKDAGAVTGVVLKGYELQPITDAIPGNAQIQAQLDMVVAGLDLALAPDFAFKKVLAETAFDVPDGSFKETPVGNLITDAFLTISRALQPTAPAVFAVEANGSIRSAVKKGSTGAIWFADLFRVEPLGIGPDGKPGYPLVTYYLNGKDIRSGLELGAAANSATLGNDDAFFLQFSGIQAEFKMDNLVFQRVKSASLVEPGRAPVPINLADETTCYKVVTTYYLAALFNFANSRLPSQLGIRAKSEDCKTPVTDLPSRIIDRTPLTPAVDELKQWQALAGYVAGLPDSDGDMIPNIPPMYAQPQGRLVLTPANP